MRLVTTVKAISMGVGVNKNSEFLASIQRILLSLAAPVPMVIGNLILAQALPTAI